MVEPGFPKFALDVIFHGKAESAMGLDTGIGSSKAGICRKQLCHIGFRAEGLMGIVQGLSQLQGMRLPNYYVTFVKTGNRMIVNEDELKKVEE